MSWDVAFSRRYEDWSAHMIADIPFYVELARKAEGPLVQLAAGNGRVAVPVAQPIGRPVIGVDSSPAMLEQARSRAAEACVELDLRECDMRELVIDQPAALLDCPRAPVPADLGRPPSRLERVAASLRPSGQFTWNAFAFNHGIAAGLDSQHQDEPVSHTIRYAVGDTESTSRSTTAEELPLVGLEERVAWAPRCCRPRVGGTLRRLRRRAIRRGQPGIRLRCAPLSEQLRLDAGHDAQSPAPPQSASLPV